MSGNNNANNGGNNSNATNNADFSISAGLGGMQLCDVSEPSMFERLSPAKRVGLLRPSTVMEDSCEDQTVGGSSASTSATTSANTSAAGAAAGLVGNHNNATAQSETGAEDVSSFAEYSMDSLAYSGGAAAPSIRSNELGGRSSHSQMDEDSLNVPSVPSVNRPFDDTLEVVEYDRTAPKYLLKPVPKTPQPTTPKRAERKLAQSNSPSSATECEVIVLDSDSSPETTFHTARTNVKLEEQSFRSVGEKNAEKPADISEVISLVSSSDSDEEEDDEDNIVEDSGWNVAGALSRPLSSVHPEAEHEMAGGDAPEATEDTNLHTNCNDSEPPATASMMGRYSTNPRRESRAAANELDDSLALATATMPDDFNDTIERMDYMMDLGRRIQEKQQQRSASKLATAAATPNVYLTTPVSQQSPVRTATSVPIGSSTLSVGGVQATSGSSSGHKPVGHRHVATPQLQLQPARNSPRFGDTATTPAKAAAPTIAKKLFRTPMANNNSPVLKAKPGASSTNNSPMPSAAVFKKPNALPSTVPRKPPTSVASSSRIPKPKSASKAHPSTAFDYVRSPIGAYIGQRAPNPLVQNCNVDRDILESTFCTSAPQELDFTLPAANAENVAPKSRLTKKAYVQAESKQVRPRIVDHKCVL